jgi:hypothetical protein
MVVEFRREPGGKMFMLTNTPDGTCPDCAVAHDPEQPHNQRSLTYLYKFYYKHGRWPSWADAMAHCTKEIKDQWIAELAECGIEVDAND